MKKRTKLFPSFIILGATIIVSLFAIGFSAWTTPNKEDPYETVVNVNVEDLKFAGFSNLVSKKSVKFDAKTDDNEGRVVYTPDIGGEQLQIDITGTVLNYSSVGSVQISGAIDWNHTSIFNELISDKYIIEPTFEELTRKNTTVNPTANGSYWTSDHDTANNTRNFEIIASFGWGDFFANMNPSLFFDSLSTNHLNKSGKDYSQEDASAAINKVHQLTGATYNVRLGATAFTYTINFESSDTPIVTNLPDSLIVNPEEDFTIPSTTYSVAGYDFKGYSHTKNSSSAEYLVGQSYSINQLIALDSTVNAFTLYTVFNGKSITVKFVGGDHANNYSTKTSTKTYGSTITLESAPNAASGYKFTNWKLDANNATYNAGASITLTNSNISNLSSKTTITFTAQWESTSGGGTCLLPETKITMADGTYKEVQYIESGDLIQVFNHENGTLDVSPVIFNEKEEPELVNIINLHFSNGAYIGDVYEHGFFDMDTLRYEYIRESNYAEFIGHHFYDESGEIVVLENAYISQKYTEVYSPVSYFHLNLFTEGILSMPGNCDGFINIFEVDPNLQYNQESYYRDIATYGLCTYEDLAEYGITEDIFNAYAGMYIYIAMGKGILTEERLMYLMERYALLYEQLL